MSDFGITVLVGLAAVTGAIAGHFLKELLPSIAIEHWKARRDLASIFQKYRDPIVLSATELVHRLQELEKEYPAEFLGNNCFVFEASQPSLTTTEDPYYQTYKATSTLYRLCSFLGWTELFREEIVYLTSGRGSIDKDIERSMKRIRSALADGHLNSAENWEEWADQLIFREEQRAIGEVMIGEKNERRSVIGYAEFRAARQHADKKPWFEVAERFLENLSEENDFRRQRLRLLTWGLVDLIEFVNEEKLSQRLGDARRSARELLEHDQLMDMA